jgi:arabinoxylan arabinofuranohydrolase
LTAKATLRLTASTTTYVSLASAAINSSGWTLVTGAVPVLWSGTLTGVLFYVESAAGTDNLYIADANLH